LFNFEDIEIRNHKENMYFFHYITVGSGNYLFCKIFELEINEYIEILSQWDIKILFGNIFFKYKEDAESALELLFAIYILNKLSK